MITKWHWGASFGRKNTDRIFETQQEEYSYFFGSESGQLVYPLVVKIFNKLTTELG